ncbi:MAG: trigger factor, partial [Oculatellaceae cyanobacterium bins.114]|nr:trigger factor [Oculatellaceae cyanobacterium bins.114]
MKVTQEKLPASQIGLEIEITPEASKQAYEKTLQDFMRSMNIPGFRKGKVPRQVLIQRLGLTRIKATVIEELIDSSLKKAIEQEKIEAIGNFELRSPFEDLISQYDPGSAFTFSAAVDVSPTATLDQYQGFQLQAEEVAYDPQKVDEVLESYRNRMATLVPVENRVAQRGDVAVVDFTGRLSQPTEEGSDEIQGGSATDFEIELVEGKFIEGFIDGIIGMTSGETKEVSVNFPEGYPQADLAGKPAVFSITLKDLKEKELPELDDDFAQEISEFETLQELRDSLESRFKKE